MDGCKTLKVFCLFCAFLHGSVVDNSTITTNKDLKDQTCLKVLPCIISHTSFDFVSDIKIYWVHGYTFYHTNAVQIL